MVKYNISLQEFVAKEGMGLYVQKVSNSIFRIKCPFLKFSHIHVLVCNQEHTSLWGREELGMQYYYGALLPIE